MNEAKKENGSKEALVKRGDRKLKAICNLYFWMKVKENIVEAERVFSMN